QNALAALCLSAQCDRSVVSMRVVVAEPSMTTQILPTVGSPDISAAQLHERRMGGQTHGDFTALRKTDVVLYPRAIVMSGTVQVGRENRDEPIRALNLETHEQNVAPRVGKDFEHDLIVIAMVSHGERGQMRAGRREPILPHALQIEPPIRTDQVEAQVADLRLSGRGPVHLVDDAVPDSCPQP